LTVDEFNNISRKNKNLKISNSLKISNNLKISNGLKKEKKQYELTCLNCNNKFKSTNKNQKCCNVICARSRTNRIRGIKSVQSQNKRSKNEIYFADLCIEKFKNILTNKPMFNGWDADIIIEDLKFAILWNGKWHYEKLTKKHSLKQVQTRDKIKINEIQKCGYNVYIIKDMGRYNKNFVKEEFEKFLKYIESLNTNME
jgi:hypothetical protein